jgi:hypothetical protein
VRAEYFKRVVASGVGSPVDVSPARVGEMLDGKEASPYEITAGEALLARWAGVPSRMGYGWYAGQRGEGADASTLSVRPKNGATWLEAYFEGSGWVPILGTPQRAKSSLSSSDTNQAVQPTEELAVITYVPVRSFSVQLLYTVVQYWVVRGLPWIVLTGALAIFYPAGVKAVRRARRKRWAASRGHAERILAAYAELRDYANDLNVGHPTSTPLEWADLTVQDQEHDELAWLVTRGLWGDLSRDLRGEDADAAEDMATSLLRRLRRGQGAAARLAAAASRSSLRDPYTDHVPNHWPRRRPRTRRSRVRFGLPRPSRLRRVPPALPSAVLVLVLLLGGCVRDVDLDLTGPSGVPERLVPEELSGLRFNREPDAEKPFTDVGSRSLVDTGRVFTIHEGDVIQGSYQVASLKPGLLPRSEDVEQGILTGLGAGRFELIRIGEERVYALDKPEQRFLLWFSANGRYYDLLVARRSFDKADDLFVSLLAYQRGDPVAGLLRPRTPPPPDARKGFE